MERDIVIRLDITRDELASFLLLNDSDLRPIQDLIWRLACHSAAYMLAARGEIHAAHRMALSARVHLP